MSAAPRRPQRKPEPFPAYGYYVVGGFVGILAGSLMALMGGFRWIGCMLGEMANGIGDAAHGAAGLVAGIATPVAILAIYFLPFIIGGRSPRAGAIFALNLLLGWTIIGWIGALVWALAESGTYSEKARQAAAATDREDPPRSLL